MDDDSYKATSTGIIAMSRSNSITSSSSSKCSTRQITSGMDGSEILQRIFNADCDPRDLDHRQLRKSFVELLEQHRKLQTNKKDVEQEKLELDYRVNLLEEEMFELEELNCELKRKLKSEQKAKEMAERKAIDCEECVRSTEQLLEHRNQLISAAGLVLYTDVDRAEECKGHVTSSIPECVLSKDVHFALKGLAGDSLDDKIKMLVHNHATLEAKLSSLTDQLSQMKMAPSNDVQSDGTCPASSVDDTIVSAKQLVTCTARELNDLRMTNDRQSEEILYIKAEKARLENALNRHKELVSEFEQNEHNMNEEKRKLKKEDANIAFYRFLSPVATAPRNSVTLRQTTSSGTRTTYSPSKYSRWSHAI